MIKAHEWSDVYVEQTADETVEVAVETVDKLCDEYVAAAKLAEKYVLLAGEAKRAYDSAERDAYRKVRANEHEHANSFAWRFKS